MEALKILPDTLISELDDAVSAAIRLVERNDRVTAGVSLTLKVTWNDDVAAPVADVTLKSGQGTKRMAILRSGQLEMSI